MIDSLGDRMKQRYEDRTRFMVPRRTYTIIRCDGRSFHTWTRGLEKPFDYGFGGWMDGAALELCESAQGAQLAFVQSDEVSVLLTDFALPMTDAWFDGNLQKMCSVAASIVSVAFNRAAMRGPAVFDARVFTIPDPVEVENYFIWRQKDAERNSLMALCQKHFSHKELEGKQRADQHDMLHNAGVNWNDLRAADKRGRCVVRGADGGWEFDREIPVFTADRDYMTTRIPRQWPETSTA